MTSSRFDIANLDDRAAWAARETRQAAAYDHICDRYGEEFPNKEGQLACGKLLLARLPDVARVLDVGCGTGLPTAHEPVEVKTADGDLLVLCTDGLVESVAATSGQASPCSARACRQSASTSSCPTSPHTSSARP